MDTSPETEGTLEPTNESTVDTDLNAMLTTVYSDTIEDTEPPLPDQIPTGEKEPEQEKPYILPIYVFTAIFGAIFVLGPLLVRRGPNMNITRCCIMISAFCCWIFWTTTYIVQMNPLLGPRLGNETLAWIGYKWGKNPLLIGNDTEGEEGSTEPNPEPGSMDPGNSDPVTTEPPEAGPPEPQD